MKMKIRVLLLILLAIPSLVYGMDNENGFKDNPSAVSAVQLHKHIVVHRGDDLKLIFKEEQKRFIIREDLDLAPFPLLEVGAHSILDFRGGIIRNGSLKGNDTRIAGKLRFDNVSLSGSFRIREISDDMIEQKSQKNLEGLFSLLNPNCKQKLTVNGVYELTTKSSILRLVSNTILILNGTLHAAGNLTEYAILHLKNCDNVIIKGKGNIIGDVETNPSQLGASGHGIVIYNSHKVQIEGISIKKCWGDGIYFAGDPAGRQPSSNIYIHNVTLDSNRRQGISIIHANDVHIENNKIINTGRIRGSDPQSAIDIEPNYVTQSLTGIYIKNNIIEGNVTNGIMCTGKGHTYGLHISGNITASGGSIYLRLNSHEESWIENQRINWLETVHFKNLHFKNCEINMTTKLITPANRSSGTTFSEYVFGNYSYDGAMNFKNCDLTFPVNQSELFQVYQGCKDLKFRGCKIVANILNIRNTTLHKCDVYSSIRVGVNKYLNSTLLPSSKCQVVIRGCELSALVPVKYQIYVFTLEKNTPNYVLEVEGNTFHDENTFEPITVSSYQLGLLEEEDKLNIRFKNNVFNKEKVKKDGNLSKHILKPKSWELM